MNAVANINAEQSVIGGLLTDNAAYDRLGHLDTAHFYRADHQAIFTQVRKLLEAGSGADVLTVYERMQAEAPDMASLVYLNEMASSTPSTANIGRYASMVREKAQRRNLLRLAGDMAASAESELDKDSASIIDRAQAELERMGEDRGTAEPIRVKDDLVSYLDELERRCEGKVARAIPTGFADLDRKMMGGIRAGELIVVAARPKMGKSAFAFNVALNAARDYSVLVLSMEMPRAQIHDRNMAVMSGLPLDNFLMPSKMTDGDWASVTAAVARLESLNLALDDQGGLRLMDVRAKARAVRRKHGLDLLVIDYLQLMEGEGDNRNAQIEGITRGLKAMAKEMGIGVILLSQLNRELERRPNKRPMPSDLRDSGAIEQDCDAALFLYRDEVYNPDSSDKGVCEVNVGLIRQGEPGVVGLHYKGALTKFENLASGQQFNKPSERKVKYSALRD